MLTNLSLSEVSKEAFILRSTLCSAFKHPDVLSSLHHFIITTTTISLSLIIPHSDPAFPQTLVTGLEVLPYTELELALQDSLRSAERPSYHTDLGKQSGFCANVTCLALILVKTSQMLPVVTVKPSTIHQKRTEQLQSQSLSSLTQIINLYGTHRLLPPFFFSIVLKLCSLLGVTQTQGLKLSLDTQDHLGNVHYQRLDLQMVEFVLSLENISEGVVRKCALVLVSHMTEKESVTNLDPNICAKILKILTEDGKIKENLSVIEQLITKCTDKKVLGGIVTELNSTVMLDVLKYKDSLTILTTIATCNKVPANTRTLLAVLQCVLCDSGNTGVSLQYLYVQYLVNPAQMSDLMANRFDVIACLCSQIKFSSAHLNEALLLLLEHLSHYPDCEGIVVDLVNVVEIVEHTTSTLTLTLLWKLVSCRSELQSSAGLKYLALRSLLEPDYCASVSAAAFIRSSDFSGLPWVSVALQTSLLLDDIPGGVVWLLAHLETKQLRLTVQSRIKHLLTSLECQFQSEQQAVIMKLLTRLFEIFPEFASAVIAKCIPKDDIDSVPWHRHGTLSYHQSALSVISATQTAEIGESYSKILGYVRSNT